MTLFLALAAALTAAALAFLLPPLLRRRSTAPDARVAANAEIYREQLDELGAELQRGAISREEFERASREVERRIVAEHGIESPAPARPQAPRTVALAVAILVPLAAALGYWQTGDLRGLNVEAARPSDEGQLRELASRLVKQLEQKPDDAEGWLLLGRALFSLSQPGDAAQAYARAVQLAPENRELLVEFIKSLAVAGRAAFEQQKYGDAIEYWQRILPFAPPESDFHRTVSESIVEAKSLAGGTATSLKGVVRLDPALKAKVAPGDTVFVLARPADARGGMPLAVARTTVDKLPYAFTLDDSMAMAPTAKLSGHAKVVVTARISKSGKAGRQKGDIEGASAPVKPGDTGVHIVLSKTVD